MNPAGEMDVLGIALVMEEVGKGARLVFRYPSSPPPYFMGNIHTSHRENVTYNKGSNNNNLNEVSADKRGGSSHTGGSRQPQQKTVQVCHSPMSKDVGRSQTIRRKSPTKVRRQVRC